MAVLRLGLVLYEGHRKGVNPLWIFRRVYRPLGHYTITNVKLASDVFSIFTLIIFIFFALNIRSVYLDHANGAAQSALRACAIFGMLLQGWIVSFGLLQAHVITQESHQKGLLAPTRLNTMFVAGGLFVAIPVVASGVWNAIVGKTFYGTIHSLQTQLLDLEQSGTGNASLTTAEVTRLKSGLVTLSESSEPYKNTLVALASFTAIVAGIIFFVNVGSFILVRLLRHQIEKDASEKGIRSDGKHMAVHASKTGTAAHDDPRLRKAERYMLYSSISLATLAATGVALCVAIAVMTSNGSMLKTWMNTEFGLLSIQWLYAIVILILCTFRTLVDIEDVVERRSKALPQMAPNSFLSITLADLGESSSRLVDADDGHKVLPGLPASTRSDKEEFEKDGFNA
ncbi:hypothetical protein RQP46_006593 [Phenoliferia psychrophenolica]